MNVPDLVMQRHIAGWHHRVQTMPELLELSHWRTQQSYKLITTYCSPTDSVLEVGCLNGHHCLLLAQDGYNDVAGIEFNAECVAMAKSQCDKLQLDYPPQFVHGVFPDVALDTQVDRILLFDVIEHMTNLQSTFEACMQLLNPTGAVLVLVPLGKHYYDCGHINFWPDSECLQNHLSIYFNVTVCTAVEDGKKLFAICTLN